MHVQIVNSGIQGTTTVELNETVAPGSLQATIQALTSFSDHRSAKDVVANVIAKARTTKLTGSEK